MTAASVWAPAATRVAIEIGGTRTPMTQVAGGWWRGPESGPGSLDDGTDYAFLLDDDGPFPDPRSPWQPAGVHGPSRWVDSGRFAWTDAGWQPPPLASGVVYELHVGTFTPDGTLDSAIERLDALVDLGVSHVELMPVNAFPGRHGWGYDGVFAWAVQDAYGGPHALARFVDACHARSLAVLLDVVYNHLGPDGNVLPRFGPYLTDRYHTPWGAAVNLDGPGSDEVRAFIGDNAERWLRDFHLDGLRLDAVHAFVDLSAVHLLEELSGRVDALEQELGRPLLLIAESDLNDPRLVREREAGGYGLDAAWSDDLHHALQVTLTGQRNGYYADFEGFRDLCTALADVYVYAGRHSPLRGRRHGRPVGDLPRSRFLAYLQDHDQVGNQPYGERSGSVLSPDQLRVAAALVLLGPYVPMLFAGEEWGARTPFLYFTDHQDPALAAAVSEGRRTELTHFIIDGRTLPDPQDPETFRRSRLDWAERTHPDHAALLDWHRRCIALRRSVPALAAGPAAAVRSDAQARWLIVERPGSRLATNLGSRSVTVEVPGRWAVALASDLVSLDPAGTLALPPMSVALLLEA